MILQCNVEIPDNADAITRLDAMARASRDESLWREIKTPEARRAEIMARTDLCEKCGSCKYFEPTPHKANKSYGICHKGYVSPRGRTSKACKQYERKKNVPN